MLRVVAAAGKWVVHRRGQRLARRFQHQTTDCRSTQQQVLERLLALNAGTRFQHDHDLVPGLSVDEFRRRMPISTYQDVAGYIDALRRGDRNALCGPRNQPLMFALTSGTTGDTKHIPITPAFLDAYRRGWMVWAWHAFERHPHATRQRFLQIISDFDQWRTPSGLPCGNISGLVQSMQSPLVRHKFVVPGQAMRISDPASKRYLILRVALAESGVGLVSSANPSTLVQLAQEADAQQEALIRDIHDGTLSKDCELPNDVRVALWKTLTQANRSRARQLSQIAETTGHLLPRDYWPNAKLIAVWTGGSAGAYLPRVRELYGDVPIRDHGLQASEGRMTIPLADETSSGVLDIGSHFFEFIPAEQIDHESPPTLLADELREGESYFIVLTTSSGLYRYNISDVVRCTGFVGTTPLLEFLHKGAHISSVTGEKLTETQVVAAVSAASQQTGCRLSHYTVCPVWGDPPGYHLLVEESDLPSTAVGERLATAVEEQLLARNSEYREKRTSSRLKPVIVQFLPEGTWTRYINQRTAAPGASTEQYKHPCLSPDLNFYDAVVS